MKLKQISSRLFLPDSWSHCWPPCKLLQFYTQFLSKCSKVPYNPTFNMQAFKDANMPASPCVSAIVLRRFLFSRSAVSNSLQPQDCSTSGFLVLQYLPEFAQTHVHWVSDAIQPSHLLSPPSPPALNLSLHQGLFQWVFFAKGGQSIRVSVSASVLPMNIQRSRYYKVKMFIFYVFFNVLSVWKYYMC